MCRLNVRKPEKNVVMICADMTPLMGLSWLAAECVLQGASANQTHAYHYIPVRKTAVCPLPPHILPRPAVQARLGVDRGSMSI